MSIFILFVSTWVIFDEEFSLWVSVKINHNPLLQHLNISTALLVKVFFLFLAYFFQLRGHPFITYAKFLIYIYIYIYLYIISDPTHVQYVCIPGGKFCVRTKWTVPKTSLRFCKKNQLNAILSPENKKVIQKNQFCQIWQGESKCISSLKLVKNSSSPLSNWPIISLFHLLSRDPHMTSSWTYTTDANLHMIIIGYIMAVVTWLMCSKS